MNILRNWGLLPETTPDQLANIYLTREQERNLKELHKTELHKLLEPVVPQISKIVKWLVESLSYWNSSRTFFEAFQGVSLAFGVGLAELKLNPKEIDIPATRQLFETLYDQRVKTWLSYERLVGLAGANIVRNYMLRLAGLIKG